jgi:transaldolase
MPAKTLKAFADHGKLDTILTTDGGDAEGTLRQFADSGVDIVRWPPNLRTMAPSRLRSRGKI